MAKVKKIKGALEIIEEAVVILRRNLFIALPFYYIGTIPFVAAFLYFWSDMSQNAFAGEHVITASLGLALLFIWMKCWHAAFCGKIISYIRLQPPASWSLKQIIHTISSQSLFAGTWVMILPISIISVAPFGWVYSFYQNTLMTGDGTLPVKEIIKRSRYSANAWPGQNYIMLAFIFIFTIFVFLNICISIYLLPALMKRYLGIETVFTLSGMNMLNTTFLIISLGLTYLAVDPLIKTLYALRCFYIFSARTGDDLKTEMLAIKKFSHGLSCLIFFILFSFLITDAIAHEKTDIEESLSQTAYIIDSGDIDRAIEDIAKQREFAWRIPKEADEYETPGTLKRFSEWVVDHFILGLKYLKKAWKKIWELIKKLLPDIKTRGPSGGPLQNNAYLILYSVLTLLVCVLAVMAWRQLHKRRNPVDKVTAQAIPSLPDLTGDFVDPVELPADRWMTLGYELMKKPPLSLALRAFYLSILANLAEKGMITITRYKTNMDYINELGRRAHKNPEIINLFSDSVRVFDFSWYGMHEVTEPLLNSFINNRDRMIEIAHG